MSTLKNTNKDAGLLLAAFLWVCIRLSKDEIFFWARSRDDFKKLFLQPVSDLAKITAEFNLVLKKQSRLDKSPYHSQVDLYDHFIEACRSMSGAQIQFWLKQRSQGLMLALLQKGEIEFMPVVEGNAVIPALLAERSLSTFRSKNFRQDQFILHDVHEKLRPKYGETALTQTSCFQSACSLTGDEMISYSGGTEAVTDVSFTPEQIRHLASRQRRTKDKGLLTYEGSNCFPVLGKDKVLRMISLRWSPPSFPAPDRIGRWHYWALNTQHEFSPFSRFFVCG